MEKSEFTRDDTRVIKAVAILFMLFHHLAAFPERLPVGFGGGFKALWEPFVADGYLAALASACRICVPLFFMVGGYGLYMRYASGETGVFSSLKRLYLSYWRVFLVFVPLGLIFFCVGTDVMPEFCVRFVFDGPTELLNALVGDFLGVTSSINAEWWFLRSYVCALVLGSVWLNAFKKTHHFLTELLIVFGIDILIRDVFPAIAGLSAFSSLADNFYYHYFCTITASASCFLAGIVFAKYDIFRKLKREIKRMPAYPLFCALLFALLFWCRIYLDGAKYEIILCGLMIPVISCFTDSCRYLKTALVKLGHHSTNMWLCHTFFCCYFYGFTRLVYSTQCVWLDYIILVALSLAASLLINLLWKYLSRLARPADRA
ncbi:MAG: acyltransferase [Oscillospiraceae bacterium]|nr:acyltransferase [Oscillospiraceae bacterium]